MSMFMDMLELSAIGLLIHDIKLYVYTNKQVHRYTVF